MVARQKERRGQNSMANRTYQDYNEAAQQSMKNMALSRDPKQVLLPRGVRLIKICKPLGRDPYAVYHSAPTIKCPEYKVTAAEVDAIKYWEAF